MAFFCIQTKIKDHPDRVHTVARLRAPIDGEGIFEAEERDYQSLIGELGKTFNALPADIRGRLKARPNRAAPKP